MRLTSGGKAKLPPLDFSCSRLPIFKITSHFNSDLPSNSHGFLMVGSLKSRFSLGRNAESDPNRLNVLVRNFEQRMQILTFPKLSSLPPLLPSPDHKRRYQAQTRASDSQIVRLCSVFLIFAVVHAVFTCRKTQARRIKDFCPKTRRFLRRRLCRRRRKSCGCVGSMPEPPPCHGPRAGSRITQRPPTYPELRRHIRSPDCRVRGSPWACRSGEANACRRASSGTCLCNAARSETSAASRRTRFCRDQ